MWPVLIIFSQNSQLHIITDVFHQLVEILIDYWWSRRQLPIPQALQHCHIVKGIPFFNYDRLLDLIIIINPTWSHSACWRWLPSSQRPPAPSLWPPAPPSPPSGAAPPFSTRRWPAAAPKKRQRPVVVSIDTEAARILQLLPIFASQTFHHFTHCVPCFLIITMVRGGQYLLVESRGFL